MVLNWIGKKFPGMLARLQNGRPTSPLKIDSAKFFVWALLSVPFVLICQRFADDTITYGQVLHQTGLWSAGLLLAALAMTPMRQVVGSRPWFSRILRYRRTFGVASFAYAALHTAVYLERKWGADLILKEGLEPPLATGWIAFAIFVALAITSNDAAVRAMGRAWKKLHRWVYAATALVLAHWWLAVFDRTMAYVFLTALVVLQLPRVMARYRPK